MKKPFAIEEHLALKPIRVSPAAEQRLGAGEFARASLPGLVGLGLIAILAAAPPASAQLTFNQIALTGQPAPGVEDGAEFDFLDPPTLNAAGDVAFRASLRTGDGPGAGVVDNDNNSAIFGPGTGAGTPLTVLVREDQTAPGVDDGAEFDSFDNPTLNALGNVAFRASLRTGNGPGAGAVDSGNSSALFGPQIGPGAPLTVLAREGQTAPGVDDGAEFDILINPTLNSAGDVAFQAGLRTGDEPGAGTVDSRNSLAIFGPIAGAGTPLTLLAREGQTAPGVEDGAEFDTLAPPGLNSSGDVAFRASLRTGDGPGAGAVNPGNSLAIFGPRAGAGTPRTLLARADQAAPGVNDGAEFNTVSFFGLPALNATGDVAFQATLRTGDGPGAGTVNFDNDDAIFSSSAGAGTPLTVLAREGQTAPGVEDGAAFSTLVTPALNAAGDVAFQASLRTGDGPGAGVVGFGNDSAIFGPGSGAGTPLTVLAREDQTAPGVDDGAEFDSFDTPTSRPVLNTAGDVAFQATLRTGDGPGAGEVGFVNDQALYASAGGVLELIARTGDLFDVELAGGLTEARTISGIANSFTGFNDAGTLAFRLVFTDGTSGIFTASLIPEPGSAVLLGLASLPLIGSRRRE